MRTARRENPGQNVQSGRNVVRRVDRAPTRVERTDHQGRTTRKEVYEPKRRETDPRGARPDRTQGSQRNHLLRRDANS
jgi:hypothetical protein